MKKLISKLEQTPVQPHQWLAGISTFILIRMLLEMISSPPPLGILTFDRYFHHYLFFLAIILGLTLCIAAFLPKKTILVVKLSFFASAIICLPPMIDFIVTLGKGYPIDYLFAPPQNLLNDYLTFFGPFGNGGISLGVRIEVLLVLMAIFYYVSLSSKGVLKPLLAAWLSYTAVFIYLAIPSLFVSLLTFPHYDYPFTMRQLFIMFVTLPSFISLNIADVSPSFKFHAAGHAFFLLVYYLTITLTALLLIFLHDPKKMRSLLKEKFPHTLRYWLMLIAGATCSTFFSSAETQLNLINALYIVDFILMFFFAQLLIKNYSAKKKSFDFLFPFAGTLTGALIFGFSVMLPLAIFLSIRFLHRASYAPINRIPAFYFFLTFAANLACGLMGYLAFSIDRMIPWTPFHLLIPIAFIFAVSHRTSTR